MSQPVLSVRDLTTAFLVDGEWRDVVRNVSFDIAAGETVALVGESGSGKSVTARSIMRLLPQATTRVTGQVRLDGTELLTLPEESMRSRRGNDVAMVFQEPMTSLNPVLSTGDQLVEAIRAHRDLSRKAARAEALRLLELVRIPDARRRLDHFVHEFSGGMRQRVMIAMALACEPSLLIADEPTTALDVTIQAQVLDLFKSIQDKTGMGMLFITHDMGVVAEIADRALVMYRGDVVEQGLCTELFAQQTHPYTKALLSAIPNLGSGVASAGPVRFPTVSGDEGTIVEGQPSTRPVDRTKEPVLSVRNLTTRFVVNSPWLGRAMARIHAVEDVSFDLHQAETLAIVGESGCGKSTTGRSLLRLVQPDAGQVVLDKVELARASHAQLRRARRGMQMVFQDPFASLDPRKRVVDAIAEPLLIHNLASPAQARVRAHELLVKVGLSEAHGSRFPHEFSGGQRQRICIARSLATSPQVIIADEAVSALDVSTKAQIINLMIDLQEELGLSYIFISHDMAAVERVSHRVAVMYLGEIVEIGSRQAIFGDPRHPYTRKLLSAVPVADPGRRSVRRPPSNDELRSPVRPIDYAPPRRQMDQVGDDHFVALTA